MFEITTDLILATGALGTAAFGIVEALKWTPLGRSGFGTLSKNLGPILKAYQVAYGSQFRSLLKGLYMGDQAELIRVLRQGVRLGLREDNAQAIADFLGLQADGQLPQIAKDLSEGKELDDQARNVLGRFEMAVDAKIDAAITLAQSAYTGRTRLLAGFVSVFIAVFVGLAENGISPANFGYAFMVGIAAVPLAPITKDLVSAIQSASKALGKKS